MKRTFIFLIAMVLGLTSQAQSISFSGNIGYAKPTGDGFQNQEGNDLAGAGFAYEGDLLYHLPLLDQKLAVGLKRNASVLVAADLDNSFDIGVYGLGFWGAKAQYKVFTSKVTPYAALSLGLSQFETPEITDGDGTVLTEGESKSGFGVQPEFGLFLSGLKLSFIYALPSNYGILDGSTGAMQFNIGYAYTISL